MGFTSAFLSLLYHVVWPDSCPVCGKLAVSFCVPCLASSLNPLPPFCIYCGGPYNGRCCPDSVPCYAASLHEGASREFLLRLKYKGIRSLGVPMGAAASVSISKIEADVLVPIPLHSGSKREYNQSGLIADGVSSVWGIKKDDSVLNWNSVTERQVNKTGKDRSTLADDAMKASASLSGKRVILVDDVYTTGGTARAALEAVSKSGGRVVSALFWSRRV